MLLVAVLLAVAWFCSPALPPYCLDLVLGFAVGTFVLPTFTLAMGGVRFVCGLGVVLGVFGGVPVLCLPEAVPLCLCAGLLFFLPCLGLVSAWFRPVGRCGCLAPWAAY